MWNCIGGIIVIYITGDTHGLVQRFNTLKEKYNEDKWTENDYLIICGDFGYIFFNNGPENRFLDELEKKPYTICFVDGNHENFPAIYSYPVTNWNGGKTHQIRNNIYHLMRGQIFEIEGKTFFTMGGAYSIDKACRKEGESWWPEETPNNEEYKEASANLKKAGKKVDYIITHTMPSCMIRRLGMYPNGHDIELTGYLEWIYYEMDYIHWYCGHWHEDKDLTDEFTILYEDVRTI